MSNLLNIDVLRRLGQPSWFGLGFIQLKLNDTHRMHFWHPSLTPDVPDDEIHDHRYNFSSTILLGRMHHETWTFDPNMFGSHEMVEVSCDPAAPIVNPKKTLGAPRLTGSYNLNTGSQYTFKINEFHKSKTTRCISLLQRDPPEKEFARVIRPRGNPEICPFSNPKDPAQLWEIIEDLLRSPDGAPASEPFVPGYHTRPIEKGELGEPSKIREELEEFIDSIGQGVSIMALVELSDMLGSVEAYLAKHHPSISLNDLKAMSDVTKRAFQNGRRS
jgi:hypothetical protein